MRRISAYAKTATALFALALFAGCSDKSEGSNHVCEAEVRSWEYDCGLYIGRDEDAFLERSGMSQECSDLVDSLDDGAYWWVETDASGASVAEKVFIGENAWMRNGQGAYPGYCGLDSIGADSVLVGKCTLFLTLLSTLCHMNDSIEGGRRCWSTEECSPATCAFVFPRDPARHLDEIEGLDCINRHKTKQQILDSLAVDSTAVAVTMNDSIVEIKVLDVKMTWTKRPGL